MRQVGSTCQGFHYLYESNKCIYQSDNGALQGWCDNRSPYGNQEASCDQGYTAWPLPPGPQRGNSPGGDGYHETVRSPFCLNSTTIVSVPGQKQAGA